MLDAVSEPVSAGKTKTDQDCASYRDRCTEARCALEESTERECNQQQLKAAIFGDATDGGLQRLKHPLLDRQPVKKDDVEYDPADREEAGDSAQHRRS